jgi:predicted RNA-binding Zn ribbon-like protein
LTLNAYEEQCARLVEDFINTYDLYLDEPEHLRTVADLQHFLAAHGIEADGATQEDLDRARILREQFRAIWNAESVEQAMALLNPMLKELSVGIQFVDDGSGVPHLEFDIQPSMARLRPALRCALGILALMQNYGLQRMRACAAEPCRDVFVDTSRNASRRFCSDRCANRYNINAFRERQKGT